MQLFLDLNIYVLFLILYKISFPEEYKYSLETECSRTQLNDSVDTQLNDDDTCIGIFCTIPGLPYQGTLFPFPHKGVRSSEVAIIKQIAFPSL